VRRDLASFPRHTGYLKPDEARVRKWKERLAQLPGHTKIAISWRGGRRISRRMMRSIPLEEWGPILRVPGIDFVSVQYSDCRDELARARSLHEVDIWHWQEAIDDYDETAALVAAVDLVISVQTAAVHLAGALGQTVWALIAATPEWRYLASGEAMPWYPSVRLIRQAEMDDWSAVLDRVARDLAARAPAERSSR
jgi:hypothetical protein